MFSTPFFHFFFKKCTFLKKLKKSKFNNYKLLLPFIVIIYKNNKKVNFFKKFSDGIFRAVVNVFQNIIGFSKKVPPPPEKKFLKVIHFWITKKTTVTNRYFKTINMLCKMLSKKMSKK